jgi:hypothetical protein
MLDGREVKTSRPKIESSDSTREELTEFKQYMLTLLVSPFFQKLEPIVVYEQILLFG